MLTYRIKVAGEFRSNVPVGLTLQRARGLPLQRARAL